MALFGSNAGPLSPTTGQRIMIHLLRVPERLTSRDMDRIEELAESLETPKQMIYFACPSSSLFTGG